MKEKVIRLTCVLLIILISAAGILITQLIRDIENPSLQKLLSYPAFFEDRFFDMRMNYHLKPNDVDERIVLAKIDDYSIEKIGRFPWSRNVWAEVITKLQSFGAKVVSFDVFFPEAERACGINDPDGTFANSITQFQSNGKSKIILGYFMGDSYHSHHKEIPGSLYNFVMDGNIAAGNNLHEAFVSKAGFPIPKLADTEVGLGHVQASEDFDGVFRHYQLLTNVQEIYFPSLALLTYQFYTGDRPYLDLSQFDRSFLKLKNGSTDLNRFGETKVRWLGGAQNFPEFSIYDFLKAPEGDPKFTELVKDKIIFIGSTALGAHDLRNTPVDSMLPGVYFHMNVVHMLLEGKYYVPNDKSILFSWGFLVIGTLLMILVQLIGLPALDIFICAGIMGGMVYLDGLYLLPNGYDIRLFFCLFSVFMTYLVNTFLSFHWANKDKQFLKSAFGSYISPELIDEMYKSGEPPKLGGDSGIRTAYFTDIQGFSTFSEQLTAVKLVELLNEYLTAMTDILLEQSGTLDKYEGDAIIAFFGAPMPLEDHATRACRVALAMQEKLGTLREKWISEGEKWPKIVHEMRMRIGVNSGEIVTGNMGSRDRMNYTMMGDSVNLAARLEEAAKQYGIFTQVSMFTKDMTNELFVMRELDTIRVVGKSEPVTTYDLVGEKGKTSEDLLKLVKYFHQGLEYYKNQEWDKAISSFEESLVYEYRRYPELEGVKTNPSEIYVERCNEFKKNPPPENWDGVYTLTSK